MDATSISMAGMNAACARYDRASAALIGAFKPNGASDAGAAIVDQAQAALAFKANAVVLRTTFGATKSLLDIFV